MFILVTYRIMPFISRTYNRSRTNTFWDFCKTKTQQKPHSIISRTTTLVAPKCDETAVFFYCVGGAEVPTVAEKNSKTVGLKSTGHDKQNVTVMLLVSTAGMKKRPMIV